MITLFVLPIDPGLRSGGSVGAQSGRTAAAVAAVRPRATLVNLLAALVLSAAYSVPGTWRVVYYSLTFRGAVAPVRYRAHSRSRTPSRGGR